MFAGASSTSSTVFFAAVIALPFLDASYVSGQSRAASVVPRRNRPRLDQHREHPVALARPAQRKRFAEYETSPGNRRRWPREASLVVRLRVKLRPDRSFSSDRLQARALLMCPKPAQSPLSCYPLEAIPQVDTLNVGKRL